MKGPGFTVKSFSRPIDLVIKQAALRPEDYYLLCHAFGLPSRKLLHQGTFQLQSIA